MKVLYVILGLGWGAIRGFGRCLASVVEAEGGRCREAPACRGLPASRGSRLELVVAAGIGPWWVVKQRQRRITAAEREEISRGLACGLSGSQIAERLGRDASVINREIGRNGGRKSYRATEAQTRACRRPNRAKVNKVAGSDALKTDVHRLLNTGASPKQIEVALHRQYPQIPARHVSHETIYDYIYLHAKGAVRKQLIGLLRRKKPCRTPAPKARSKLSGQLPGAVHISKRPAEVDLREVPGHWEADLVMGAGNRTALLVAVERTTRYVLLIPLKAKDATSVGRALARALKGLPAQLRKTLTYDNGREMAQHAQFTMATNMQVYFCDPHSPWQRGSVENTNGLVREHFPKGTNFHAVTAGQIAKVEWRLNNRPRVALDGLCPAQALDNLIHSDCALAG